MLVPYGRPDPDYIQHHLEAAAFWYLIGSIVTIVVGISSWVFGCRMRQRIKKDLGRAADNADLASIGTWMKVDEIEEEKHPGQQWAPDTKPPYYEDPKGDL
jgi:hypothetical protein